VIADQDWGNGWQAANPLGLRLTTANKKIKREKFLSEMEVVVHWQMLIALNEPPLT
jgi:hypothetical protein